MITNRHEAYELAQMQSLPLSAKLRMSERRVKEWYEAFDGQVYVSRSGGKDSDVLGDIVKKLYPDVPQVFVNTGLEHDSVRVHGTSIADEVLRPETNFVEVITKHGYPIISKEVAQIVEEARIGIARGDGSYAYRIAKLNGELIDKNTGKKSQFNCEKWKFLVDAPFKISSKCCDVMKKKPIKQYEKISGRKGYIGTMASESRIRKQRWLRYGCNSFENGKQTSTPLAFWTEHDILQYILENDVEIADAYGDVVYKDDDGMFYTEPTFANGMKLTTTKAKRTGCVFCMFGITQDTDRFLRLKESEPKKYDYVMRGGKFNEQGMWIPHQGLGYAFVIDWLNEHGNLNIKY